MDFKDYEYRRPDLDHLSSSINTFIEEFKNASSVETQNECIVKINTLRNEYETMENLAYIRSSIDTTDSFYEEEQNFIDENSPKYQQIVTNYYQALIQSPFKAELENKRGKQLFTLAEYQLKTFSEDIMGDLSKENKLVTQYNKLIASAKIPFEGEDRNLSQMVPFMEDEDRTKRKAAYEAYSNFFATHEDEFDTIYDSLVKVRDTIAKKLGFKNFVELGYIRMNRSEYDATMVANYRKQVKESLVPLVTSLKERQRERLKLDNLKYYDEGLEFTTGNAIPQGTPEWILDNAKKMYQEMSNETHEFFTFMTENKLLDLVSKKGKRGGGYCTYIPNYHSPFIFSNFNGTSGDVDVLTHEAGHAFQVYQSRDLNTPEYNFPTYEAAEIHSMSMEFIAWPWMDLFFKHQTEKYKFSHLSGSVNFIPYGVTVDEFQHFVYENPEVSKEERKTKWREIEKNYLPFKDYEDNDLYNRGGFWFKQAHIFASPFYYIDYTLAQVCAFQFFNRMQSEKEEAWQDYVNLCKVGGSKPFLELVSYANLKNPFVDGTIKEVVAPIKAWLDAVDDKKL